MRSTRGIPVGGAFVAAFVLAAAWTPAAMPSGASPPPIHADGHVLERVLRDSGVEQTLPGPNWSAYVGEIVRALLDWLFAPIGRFVTGSSPWVQGVVWLLLAVVVSILAVWLVRWLMGALRASRRPRALPEATVEPGDASTPPDPIAWRAEVDARLTQGRIEAALEAVWWWMASSMMEKDVDAAWTSRELLAAARRPDLGPLAGDLDRMMYGPTRPSRSELSGLVRRLEAGLA